VPNINFQQELLNLSAECAVRKFIGIGSQSEYGDFEGVIDENFPVNPKTAYAASKLACQDLLKCFCEINHIEWYWFREFPLFGPGESDRWLIPSLIKAMCTKDSMDLTPGEQLLPYLYVGECAKAIVSPLQTDDKSGIYNVCADNPRPLKELVTMIKDKVNPAFKLNFGALPYRFGQSMFMGSHTDKLARNLYTLDTTSFETHLQETINHYVNLYTK
jgi:nucleoside-diphosphate-sugar epimerase